MPAVWWSASVRPGSAVKLGNSDSARFIRKVPEPQRNSCMRRRNSGVERAVRHHRGVEQLEIGVDRDRVGADDAAVVQHHAARAAALDQQLAHRRAGLDLDAVARRRLGHGLADRAHAADGVAPDPALAVHLAEGVMQQHVAGAGRVGAAVEAHHRVEAEQRLHQVVLEPVVEMLARRAGEQAVERAQVGVRQTPELAAERAGLDQLAEAADARRQVRRRLQHQLAQDVDRHVDLAVEGGIALGVAAG